MSAQRLMDIIEELTKAALFPLQQLRVNEYNLCVIPLPDGHSVQLELDPREESLVIATVLGTVTAGTYRNHLFKEALKYNGQPPPRVGTLAFSTKTDHLLLYDKRHLRELNGGALAEHLPPFLEKAAIWREAIGTGIVPTVAQAPSFNSIGQLFGLR